MIRFCISLRNTPIRFETTLELVLRLLQHVQTGSIASKPVSATIRHPCAFSYFPTFSRRFFTFWATFAKKHFESSMNTFQSRLVSIAPFFKSSSYLLIIPSFSLDFRRKLRRSSILSTQTSSFTLSTISWTDTHETRRVQTHFSSPSPLTTDFSSFRHTASTWLHTALPICHSSLFPTILSHFARVSQFRNNISSAVHIFLLYVPKLRILVRSTCFSCRFVPQRTLHGIQAELSL